MPVVVRCRECSVPLSVALERLVVASSSLKDGDKQPHVPRGRLVVSDGESFTETEGQIMVHLSDAINTRHHEEARRLQGCCGLDGCNGRNTVCCNGHEVGTEKSDCWMPHVLLLDAGMVVVKDAG